MPHGLEAFAHAPITFCVGESDVSKSGCASSSACSSVNSLSYSASGDLRLVEHVVLVRVVVQQFAQLGHALRG